MKSLGGRADRQAPAINADAKPDRHGKVEKVGKSGEGARSALEQLMLQEAARELGCTAEAAPAAGRKIG